MAKLELAGAPNSPTDLSATVPNKDYFKRVSENKEFHMLEEDWDEFPQILHDILAAGLVARRDDGTYALTILGLLEVEYDRVIHARPTDSATESGNGRSPLRGHAHVFSHRAGDIVAAPINRRF